MSQVRGDNRASIGLLGLQVLAQVAAMVPLSTLFNLTWTMLERPNELSLANQGLIVGLGCVHYWGMVGSILCAIYAVARRRSTTEQTPLGRRIIALGREIRCSGPLTCAAVAVIICGGGPIVGGLTLGSTLWCQQHPWLTPIGWASLLPLVPITGSTIAPLLVYRFLMGWFLPSAKSNLQAQGPLPALYDRDLDAA